MNAQCFNGYFISVFLFGFFTLYCYCWWIASLMVANEWRNYGINNYGETLKFSNIFICFQAIAFSMFTFQQRYCSKSVRKESSSFKRIINSCPVSVAAPLGVCALRLELVTFNGCRPQEAPVKQAHSKTSRNQNKQQSKETLVDQRIIPVPHKVTVKNA